METAPVALLVRGAVADPILWILAGVIGWDHRRPALATAGLLGTAGCVWGRRSRGRLCIDGRTPRSGDGRVDGGGLRRVAAGGRADSARDSLAFREAMIYFP